MAYLMALRGGDYGRVTPDQVREAFAAGNCVYIHGRLDGGTWPMLSLDGPIDDTRGQCYSVREEQWSTPVKTLQDAMFEAGRYGPIDNTRGQCYSVGEEQ